MHNYYTHIDFAISQSEVMSCVLISWDIRSLPWYNITDSHLDEFGFSKESYLTLPNLIVLFLVCFRGISGLFGLAIGILPWLYFAKTRTMAQSNSPNIPPKCTKKVQCSFFLYQKGTIRYYQFIITKITSTWYMFFQQLSFV